MGSSAAYLASAALALSACASTSDSGGYPRSLDRTFDAIELSDAERACVGENAVRAFGDDGALFLGGDAALRAVDAFRLQLSQKGVPLDTPEARFLIARTAFSVAQVQVGGSLVKVRRDREALVVDCSIVFGVDPAKFKDNEPDLSALRDRSAEKSRLENNLDAKP